MPDMFEAFAKGGAIGTSVEVGNFKQNLERFAQRVSDDFVKYGKDMDESIAKIAKENSFNDEQIQRLVEESNNSVYLAKYAQLKGQSERDVSFKVASSTGVKNILGDAITKKASYEDNFHVDSFSCYNPYKTGAMTPAKPESLTKAVAEKLASDLNTASKNLENANHKFDAHLYKIADMLIRYDRLIGGVPGFYEAMCKEAGLNSSVQNVIKKVASNIIEDEKFAGRINSEYELKLPRVDIFEKEADFSLGKHSRIDKYASYIPSMQLGDTVVSSVNDMIKLAKEIRPLFEDVSKAKIAYNKARKRAEFK